MYGKALPDSHMRFQYCEIIFNLEHGRSVIAYIEMFYENGIQVSIVDPKDYGSVYRKGEKVYITPFPGMQIKRIRPDKLEEYITCES